MQNLASEPQNLFSSFVSLIQFITLSEELTVKNIGKLFLFFLFFSSFFFGKKNTACYIVKNEDHRAGAAARQIGGPASEPT